MQLTLGLHFELAGLELAGLELDGLELDGLELDGRGQPLFAQVLWQRNQMIVWINRILLLLNCIAVALLFVTSLPALREQQMTGSTLMLHMMAGGSLVFALPVFALMFLGPAISLNRSARSQRLGFWLFILTGLVTISSVLLCMLPLLATEQMHFAMLVHGYAGLATVPALLIFVIGGLHRRRMTLTRSATPG